MQKQTVYQEAQQVLAEAELLYSATEVEKALERITADITSRLADKNPVCLCMMTGGIIPAGLLIPKLDFPLEVDYIHATRYRGETSGSDIQWIYKPETGLGNRTVLLIDDILDEGITLAAVISECKKQGAADIYTVVLVDKQLNRPRTLETADFTGLTVPDRYVFGFGMDYKGYLRNAPGIYAVKEK
ncbi:MAG TPA: hypoxanthine-guanine phosphoribosyltransferase [Gammaproteobacteria bacterium]|nr:hypoxanthine-guanine phosphoribosyltransferase [Gammaproteobacteria bacterium]